MHKAAIFQSDYVQFTSVQDKSDGTAGFIGQRSLLRWPMRPIALAHETYCVGQRQKSCRIKSLHTTLESQGQASEAAKL